MKTFSKREAARRAVVVLALAFAACAKSDVVAPDGSTISLTANPATIILSGGKQSAPVSIVATVSNSIGVPLTGQDVRFTTTAGSLSPPAGTTVPTDDSGNATTILTDAQQPPTITAKSGKATQTLQIQTATCSLSSIVLSPSPITINTCQDTFNITASATDTAGAPCSGILINYAFAGTNTTTDVLGSFNPASSTTNASGTATTLLTINSTDCNTKCTGKVCTGSIKATSGGTSSTLVTIVDNVP